MDANSAISNRRTSSRPEGGETVLVTVIRLTLSGTRPLHRQAYDSADGFGRVPTLRPGKAERVRHSQNVAERNARFQSRQAGPETKVLTAAKGDAFYLTPARIELLRMGEYRRIAVSRAQQQQNAVAFLDLLTADRRGAAGDPHHALHRTFQARHLGHNGFGKRGVLAGASVEVGVVQQPVNAGGYERGRGLHGDDESEKGK